MQANIHPTAMIDDSAKIGKEVVIGHNTMIGPNVQISDGCHIGHNVTIQGNVILGMEVQVGPNTSIGLPSHTMDFQNKLIKEVGGTITVGEKTIIENNVTIKGNTTMGEQNLIGAHSTIGLPAQAKQSGPGATYVIIGSGNQIREYVSIQCGTIEGGGITTVGNNNLILVYSHLAHDTRIGDHCALSNSTNLAGHVQLGSYVVTGGFACFHQYCKVGDFAMAGGMSGVYQDLAPYMLCTGHRATLYGINLVGLQRNGFSSEEIQQAQKIYSIFFCQSLAPVLAKREVQEKVPDGPVKQRFLDFIEKSKRGLVAKEVP